MNYNKKLQQFALDEVDVIALGGITPKTLLQKSSPQTDLSVS
jgi:hypothetical protein